MSAIVQHSFTQTLLRDLQTDMHPKSIIFLWQIGDADMESFWWEFVDMTKAVNIGHLVL